MAQRTIARMYDSYDDAKAVVSELEASGVPHSEISLVANADAHGRAVGNAGTSPIAGERPLDPADRTDRRGSTGGATGAVLGTVLGGGAGLLAGIGALAIPGVGPVVAAGWLVATLAGAGIGAASGGLVGSLVGAGVSHEEAHVYAEGISRGGSLVTVRADETDASRVETLMAKHGSVDWQQRRTSFGDDWKGFDTSRASGAPASEVEPTYESGSDPARRL